MAADRTDGAARRDERSRGLEISTRAAIRRTHKKKKKKTPTCPAPPASLPASLHLLSCTDTNWGGMEKSVAGRRGADCTPVLLPSTATPNLAGPHSALLLPSLPPLSSSINPITQPYWLPFTGQMSGPSRASRER